MKKKKGKKFQPIFAPLYVSVFAEDEEGTLYRLQISRPFKYTSSELHIFVRKP